MEEKSEQPNPEEILGSTEYLYEDYKYDKSRPFIQALKLYENKGNIEMVANMKHEIIVLDLATDKNSKEYFKYRYILENEEGDKIEYPDIKTVFTNELKEYLKKRVSVSNNPLLKARYSDILFTIYKEFSYYEIAVSYYVESILLLNRDEWEFQLHSVADRGLQLATKTMHKDGLEKVLGAFKQIMNDFEEKEKYRYQLELAESLIKYYKKLNGDIFDYDFVLTKLEKVLIYYSETYETAYLYRITLEHLHSLYQLQKNKQKSKEAMIKIASSYEEEARWKIDQEENYMLASNNYETALKIYLDIGNFQDKIEELKILIAKSNEKSYAKFQKFEEVFEIPKITVEKYLENYKKEEDYNVFLNRLCMDENITPSWRGSEKVALEIMEKSVFTHLMPIEIMKGNIKVKTIDDFDEKKQYHTANYFRISYLNASQMFLTKIFNIFKEINNGFEVDRLLSFISETSIVNEDRQIIIRRGIERYFEDDFISSTSILVFQIEGILRDMLKILGLPTFSYRNNEMRERMLSDSIDTLANKGLDTDLIHYLSIFLNDITGDNLRNDFAHGISTSSQMNQCNAAILILLLIKLSRYTKTENQ